MQYQYFYGDVYCNTNFVMTMANGFNNNKNDNWRAFLLREFIMDCPEGVLTKEKVGVIIAQLYLY